MLIQVNSRVSRLYIVLAKCTEEEVCDPRHNGSGLRYVENTYQNPACPELNSLIRNEWLASCIIQKGHVEVMEWRDQINSLKMQLEELNGNLLPRIQNALVGLKFGFHF